MICKSPINPITNPNTVSNHLTYDNILANTAVAIFRVDALDDDSEGGGGFGSHYADLTVGGKSHVKL
jgi:hypothetical protein